VLIEPGAGNMTKAELLLQSLDAPYAFVPFDISKTHLQKNAMRIAKSFPDLKVHAVSGDFLRIRELDSLLSGHGKRVLFFPGSSIGNFEPKDAEKFLTSLRSLVGDGGYVLVGVDVKKEPAIITAAYNDAAGITVAFEKNVLLRINRELGSTIAPETFHYEGIYNEAAGRVEMYLSSMSDQKITIADHSVSLASGERILIEYSYKYSIDEFNALATAAGMQPVHAWLDPHKLFSLHLLQA
jgi:dimethylhistidine N-methyltransferase